MNAYTTNSNLRYTDAVRDELEKTGNFWIIDIIAMQQSEAKFQKPGLRGFQRWTLKTNVGETAKIFCHQANGKVAATMTATVWDEIAEDIVVHVSNGEIFLPSER